MLRLCLITLVTTVACSPADRGEPAKTAPRTDANAQNAPAPAESGPAPVPYKTLGWDSATSQFLLEGKPFTGVTTDYYKKSGKLKARYQIKDGYYHGLVEEWYENGVQKTRTSYVNRKHEGDNFYWNEDGSLQVHKVWKDDNLVSETPGPKSPESAAKP